MKSVYLIVALSLSAAPSAKDGESVIDSLWQKVTGIFDIYEVAWEFRAINKALRRYSEETGHPLSPDRGLKPLVNEGLLDPDDITDPWGTRYRYLLGRTAAGEIEYHILSAGPDMIHGTEDDLGSDP